MFDSKGPKVIIVAAVMLVITMFPMMGIAQKGQFETDRFSDEGMDKDGDGEFELLQVSGVVNVDKSERYTLRGALVPSGNSDVDPFIVEKRLDIDIGYSSFDLEFPSGYINGLNYNGKFIVRFSLFDSTETFLSSADHETSAYRSQDFAKGGPSVELIPGSASDQGLDLDGDGAMDILEVEVLAYSRFDGSSMMFASLLGNKVCNKFEASDDKSPLSFIFDGKIILDSERNGSFLVTIGLGCERNAKALMDHKTKPYNYTDFEMSAPIATLDEIIDVRALDLDKDQSFDLLRGTITLNVFFARSYTLTAMLIKNGEPITKQIVITSKYKEGPTGVRFDFPAQEINNSHVDGPYQVVITLFKSFMGDQLDQTQTRTKAFKADDFAGEKVAIIFLKEWTDKGVDINDNGLFDILEIDINIDVRIQGRYRIDVHLGYRGFWFSDVFLEKDLDKGKGSLVLDLKGQDIYDQGSDGSYSLEIVLKNVDDSKSLDLRPPPPTRIGLTTNEYRYKDFEHKDLDTKTPGPVIIDDDADRTTTTPIMMVSTSRTRPALSFKFSNEDSKPVVFNIIYERFMVYEDANANGIYDDGEGIYEARLSTDGWVVSTIEREPLGNGGGKASYSMSTLLDLVSMRSQDTTPNYVEGWAWVTFTFTLSSETQHYVSPMNFTLKGDSEFKIDISMDFRQGVKGDGLVLEHQLFDSDHGYKFKTHESDGDHIWKAKSNALGEIFGQIANEKQKISFISNSGIEHAFYSWIPKVQVKTDTGGTKIEDVKATFSTEDLGMKLYMNYPFSADMGSLHHDPSVGVDAENVPIVVLKMTTDFDPTFYIFAMISAGVVVIVIWRKGEELP